MRVENPFSHWTDSHFAAMTDRCVFVYADGNNVESWRRHVAIPRFDPLVDAAAVLRAILEAWAPWYKGPGHSFSHGAWIRHRSRRWIVVSISGGLDV